MRSRKAVLCLAAAILVGLQVLAPAIAAACSPAWYQPVEALAEADVAFVGTVADLKEEQQFDANGIDYTARYTYVFQVLTSWKGVSQPRVTVHWERHVTGRQPGEPLPILPCGPFGYTAGSTYLVYAEYEESGLLTATIYYGRNDEPVQSLDVLAEEFRLFGAGKQWSKPAGVGMPKAGAALNLGLLCGASLTAVSLGVALSICDRRRLSHPSNS
jgi:hypothetical protein